MKKTIFLIICFLKFKYFDKTTSSIYALMELIQIDWTKRIKKKMIAKKFLKKFKHSQF